MGHQGPLTEPIFPILTVITLFAVDEIQASDDLFPALETINWRGATAPEQVASLVRYDIKRIDIVVYDMDEFYEPLLEAMGGHTIYLISLEGHFSDQIEQLADNGERIFPGFPNIREVTLSRGYSYTS
jgi:hypothetical protein